MRTWSDVVTTFLNGSEIGNEKGQWNPNIRPINLLLGGIITVRLRKYKTSHPDKGIIRVFADPRLGFDPIQASMERGAAAWRREMHRREREEIGALGVVDARATFEDRHFPRSELEAELVARDRFFEGKGLGFRV
jgi:hypothetical protein